MSANLLAAIGRIKIFVHGLFDIIVVALFSSASCPAIPHSIAVPSILQVLLSDPCLVPVTLRSQCPHQLVVVPSCCRSERMERRYQSSLEKMLVRLSVPPSGSVKMMRFGARLSYKAKSKEVCKTCKGQTEWDVVVV